MSDEPLIETTIWIQSGIAPRHEHRPFVQLFKDAECLAQLTPATAREIAHNLMEAAEAAEQESLLVRMFLERGLSHGGAMSMLGSLRLARELAGKSGPRSDAAEFVATPAHEKRPKHGYLPDGHSNDLRCMICGLPRADEAHKP